MDTSTFLRLSPPHTQDRERTSQARGAEMLRGLLTRPRLCIPAGAALGSAPLLMRTSPLSLFPSFPDGQHASPWEAAHAAA